MSETLVKGKGVLAVALAIAFWIGAIAGCSGPEEAESQSAEELTAEAKKAAVAEDYERALTLCEQALEKDPSEQKAVMLCVIAACNLKDAETAQRHYDSIRSESRQSMARQICKNQDVVIEPQ